jgi:saccharopine dehydrogenase-like NADP-dependent oxidoreductase
VAILREIGFFSKEKIEIEGKKIRPLDFTSKLLFPKWKFENGDRDITVMKVIIEGKKNGRKLKYTYDLIDRFDETTNTHSMAKTTGYTATMTVRAILAGLYMEKGISAPEFIGKNPECVHFILKGLKDRGIIYRESIIDLN